MQGRVCNNKKNVMQSSITVTWSELIMSFLVKRKPILLTNRFGAVFKYVENNRVIIFGFTMV